jgi:hypothetical protein
VNRLHESFIEASDEAHAGNRCETKSAGSLNSVRSVDDQAFVAPDDDRGPSPSGLCQQGDVPSVETGRPHFHYTVYPVER